MRLTKKTKNGYFHKSFGDSPIYTREQMISDLDDIVQKLGQLEDIEESMGVDLIAFLSELLFVLSNCNGTIGYTTDRKPIMADYGYVEDFINRLKEAINQEKRIGEELK